MKAKYGLIIILSFFVVLAGCSESGTGAKETSEGSIQNQQGKAYAVLNGSSSYSEKNFRAHLKGREEVPEVETQAQGQAIFKLSRDGSSISYKLIAANVENILMAHIHLAPAGTNGPIVVWLYPSAPPPLLIPGRFSGVLAEGTITAADLMGPLTGLPLEDLVSAMASGGTYVNLHTQQNAPGEVRGQIF